MVIGPVIPSSAPQAEMLEANARANTTLEIVFILYPFKDGFARMRNCYFVDLKVPGVDRKTYYPSGYH